MELSNKITARIHPDNPWLKQVYLAKDPYIPKKISGGVDYGKMEAGEARAQGFEVDSDIPDDQLVDVRINDFTVETRLVNRCKGGKLPRKSYFQDVRVELALAAEYPFNYITSKDLIKRVREEIEHWITNDMEGEDVHPLLFVLLGNRGDWVFVRGTFYISKDDYDSIVVIDGNSRENVITFEGDARRKCIVRRFILFAPSNLKLHDPQGNVVL